MNDLERRLSPISLILWLSSFGKMNLTSGMINREKKL
jgi:hypothetical protein